MLSNTLNWVFYIFVVLHQHDGEVRGLSGSLTVNTTSGWLSKESIVLILSVYLFLYLQNRVYTTTSNAGVTLDFFRWLLGGRRALAGRLMNLMSGLCSCLAGEQLAGEPANGSNVNKKTARPRATSFCGTFKQVSLSTICVEGLNSTFVNRRAGEGAVQESGCLWFVDLQGRGRRWRSRSAKPLGSCVAMPLTCSPANTRRAASSDGKY